MRFSCIPIQYTKNSIFFPFSSISYIKFSRLHIIFARFLFIWPCWYECERRTDTAEELYTVNFVYNLQEYIFHRKTYYMPVLCTSTHPHSTRAHINVSQTQCILKEHKIRNSTVLNILLLSYITASVCFISN